MNDLKWEDPLDARNSRNTGKGKWQAVVAALKERPGTWALVAEGVNKNVPSHLNSGKIGGTNRGEVAAVGRNQRIVEGRLILDVYARYVGNGSNGDQP